MNCLIVESYLLFISLCIVCKYNYFLKVESQDKFEQAKESP